MSGAHSPPVPERLAGRTGLITGAAGGIGRAVALRLAQEGARLVLLDLDAAGVEVTAQAVRSSGGDAFAMAADVSQRADVRRALEQARQAGFAPVQMLVNNAAWGRPASFLEIRDEDWQRMLSVNLTGVFIVAQEVAADMVAHGGGRIVNVASLAAHTANSHQAAYAASKGGVVALSRVMAFELAPHGILVNAVSPGPIDTELAARMLTPAARVAREQRIPQGRLGQPEEVAAAIAFLLCDDASYINGTVLVIDGGLVGAGIRAE